MSKRFLIAVLLFVFTFSHYSFADISKLNKLIEEKKYTEAKKIVNELLNFDNKNPQLLFIDGVLLSELGEIDNAINVFISLTKSHPALPEPYNNLAVLYAQNGNFDLARTALEKSIKTHPSYATAHINHITIDNTISMLLLMISRQECPILLTFSKITIHTHS